MTFCQRERTSFDGMMQKYFLILKVAVTILIYAIDIRWKQIIGLILSKKRNHNFVCFRKKHKVLRRLRIRPIWGVHCRSYIGNYCNCHFSLLLKHEMFLVRTKLPSGENPSLTQKANFAQDPRIILGKLIN